MKQPAKFLKNLVIIVGLLVIFVVAWYFATQPVQASPIEQSAPAQYKLGEDYTLFVVSQEKSTAFDAQCMWVVKNDNRITAALSCQPAGNVTVRKDELWDTESHLAWVAKVSRTIGGRTCFILLPKVKGGNVFISCY